jgi:hypothetical protein
MIVLTEHGLSVIMTFSMKQPKQDVMEEIMTATEKLMRFAHLLHVSQCLQQLWAVASQSLSMPIVHHILTQ